MDGCMGTHHHSSKVGVWGLHGCGQVWSCMDGCMGPYHHLSKVAACMAPWVYTTIQVNWMHGDCVDGYMGTHHYSNKATAWGCVGLCAGCKGLCGTVWAKLAIWI